jgi:Secretion system C-terminal sorting domain
MRNILFLLFLCPAFILPQEISFSKDSLYFENLTTENTDTIWVYNHGDDTLIVDSILSVNYMAYGIKIIFSESSDTVLNTVNPEAGFSLTPKDSALVIFYNPDICPICKVSGYEFFNDTIIFINNSLNNNRDSIPSSGYGFLYGDDGVGIDPENNYNFTYELFQNYPNPFNPETRISFHLPESELVSILILNSEGQIIDKLFNKRMPPGTHQIIFNGSSLSSGLYFYKIIAGSFSKVKKMLLIK